MSHDHDDTPHGLQRRALLKGTAGILATGLAPAIHAQDKPVLRYLGTAVNQDKAIAEKFKADTGITIQYVAVTTDVEFLQDATVWGLFPHTHLRGKKWEYTLQLPNGETKPILAVPRYDFNWQTYYMFSEPLQVPKGAKIVSTAWYDNSAANKNNPDSKVDVRWGDQTWEEMQYSGILVSAR